MINFDWYSSYQRHEEDNKTTMEYIRFIADTAEFKAVLLECRSCKKEHDVMFRLTGDRYEGICENTKETLYARSLSYNPIMWLI